jgi:type II secretory pathway component PulF
MVHHDERLFTQELIAMVQVGEESGKLSSMLQQAAQVYYENVQRSVSFLTTIFQPMLIIILGLLIALLIFSIYLPVFNLAGAL